MIKPISRKQAKALEQLWNKHNRLLFAIADRYCPNRDEADDVVHDVVLRLSQHIDKLSAMNADQVNRYLIKAVRNEVISHIRVQKKREQHLIYYDNESISQIPDNADIEDTVLQQEQVQHLFILLENLSPKEQAALRLKRLEHASNAEIAQAIGISETSVGQYVKRAQEKLSTLYHQEEES